MGIVISLVSALGITGCGANNFKPTDDAVITEMHISYSGMARNSQYFFSLVADDDAVVFNGEYFSDADDGSIIMHRYEDVSVNSSYMDELRKLADKNGLVDSMKKHRDREQSPMLLDGDMKGTTIVMSDGTNKSADTIFGSDYHAFFLSIAEAYADYDIGEDLIDAIDEQGL